MTELTLQPREQNFQPNLVDVVDCKSFTDAVEHLKKLPPGIALLDSDNTMREPFEAGKKGKFGEVPQKVLEELEELQERGWKLAVVTNQPEKGHQVAKVVSEARGYEAFPTCFEKRNIKVFGGGWGFLIRHFKRSRQAVQKGQNWVKKQVEELKGEKGEEVELFMIGDRESDIKFINRLANKLQGENFIRSIKMLKLPGKDKGLARFSP